MPTHVLSPLAAQDATPINTATSNMSISPVSTSDGACIASSREEQREQKLRVASFDLARGLSIVKMIYCHVYWMHGANSANWHLYYSPLTAPFFHFLMGVSIGMTPVPLSSAQATRRGLSLLMLGYVTTFLTSVLSEAARIYLDVGYDDERPLLDLFLEPDSLHSAGIAIVFLVWLRPHDRRFYVLSIVVVIIASHWMWEGIDVGNIAIQGILRIFLEQHDIDNYYGVYGQTPTGLMMPVFPWLAYSIIGMFYGREATTAHNIREFHNIGAFYGTVLVLPCVALASFKPHFIVPEEYHRSGPVGVIWISGTALWLLWILDRVKEMVPLCVHQKLTFWSKNVTQMFVIHWFIICWFPFLFSERKDLIYHNKQGKMGVALITLLTIFVTDSITKLSSLYRNQRRNTAKTKKKLQSMNYFRSAFNFLFPSITIAVQALVVATKILISLLVLSAFESKYDVSEYDDGDDDDDDGDDDDDDYDYYYVDNDHGEL